MYKVIISNGVFRFHLVTAAVEAVRRGTLALFLTGAYPKGWLAKAVEKKIGLASPGMLRFMDRANPELEERQVKPLWIPELLIQAGVASVRALRLHRVNEWMQGMGLWAYGWLACRSIKSSDADIYHYRAGYGGWSVKLAKRRGMLCLCDHSVVSPLVFDFMVHNQGRIPGCDVIAGTRLSPAWKHVLADIEAADHILANSELVKTTLICHQIERERVSVIYQGLDEKFAESIPSGPHTGSRAANHILFAGEVSRRKGFDLVIQALESIPQSDWVLTVAGNIDEVTAKDYELFMKRDNVHQVGFVSRKMLAVLMKKIPIFLFPSLAEGSARVVFEALACGCYVITTPNAGSVVEDGRHGAVVPPGNSEALRAAIESALRNPELVSETGMRNREFVRLQYSQSAYGDQLDALYRGLLMNRTPSTFRSDESAVPHQGPLSSGPV
ncbi:BceJ [Caballeronia udeis]|uniref:BceJ n=1 Tax=Caballeronia udeis TaxID=1232866 RepID=A0A158GPU8_9BURK|nr:glycosyltransferase [Caballeronia udeis]SAL34146.1 BceJ [Caballeronia udeis]